MLSTFFMFFLAAMTVNAKMFPNVPTSDARHSITTAGMASSGCVWRNSYRPWGNVPQSSTEFDDVELDELELKDIPLLLLEIVDMFDKQSILCTIQYKLVSGLEIRYY